MRSAAARKGQLPWPPTRMLRSSWSREQALSRQAGRRPCAPQDFREIAERYAAPDADAQAGALLAMRRALLLGALPAPQSYPRLAAPDRRGPAAARPTSSPTRPRPCPRSAAASARRTGCAKAIASSSSPATAPSPSARSRSSSPTPRGTKAGSSRCIPRRDRDQSVGIIGAGPRGPHPPPNICAVAGL